MSTMPPGAIPVDDPSLVGEVDMDWDPDAPISAIDHPEAANAATAAALEAANPHPVMRTPDNGVIELPGGWRGPDGNVYTQAVVRELNGRDEERLSRIDPFENTSLYLNTLLELGVESVGHERDIKAITPSLLAGDREMLIFGIRIATYGNEREQDIECPHCNKGERIKVELNKDLPIRKLDKSGEPQFDVELRNGRKARVTLPTVYIQDSVMEGERTLAERTTKQLEYCLLSIDGVQSDSDMVLGLGVVDRRTLTNAINDHQVGPDYEGVRLPCLACGKEIPVVIDLADFFL